MTAQKFLVINPENCTGCRICEIACSFEHYKSFNPRKSRVRVLKVEKMGVYIPNICRHCGDAPCMASCPTGAIYRDKDTNGVVINHELCIRCHQCVIACPFGAITIDPDTLDPIKCDLCGGDPQCAARCPREAILYIRGDRVGFDKRRRRSEAFLEVLSSIAGGGV